MFPQLSHNLEQSLILKAAFLTHLPITVIVFMLQELILDV